MSDLLEDLNILTKSLFKDHFEIPGLHELFSVSEQISTVPTPPVITHPELPLMPGYGLGDSSQFGPL